VDTTRILVKRLFEKCRVRNYLPFDKEGHTVFRTAAKVTERGAFWVFIVLTFWMTACATRVGVQRVGTREAHRLLTANVLSTGTLSEPSLQVLSRQDLREQFEQDPESALAMRHAKLQSTRDPYRLNNRLFALAELSFLHAEQRKQHRAVQSQQCHAQKGQVCPPAHDRNEEERDHAYYLATAVYAYAFLFPEDQPGAALDPADPCLRLAYDLYNRGLTAGLASLDGAEVVPAARRHPLPFGTLEIEVTAADFTWAGHHLDHFTLTVNLAVRGLRNRYRQAGIGAPLAASLAGTVDASAPSDSRIPPRLKVPVTAFLRLEAPRAGLTSGTLRGRLELYASNQTETVTINGQERPLEVESTAALAYTLEGSQVYGFELAGFLKQALRSYIPQGRSEDGLFFLQPPQLDRIPVVLVHGTASSPARWAELINELEGDPLLRQRYQIWLFIYETGNPVGYSGGRLRQALQDVMQEVDPEGKAPALQRMVVIGPARAACSLS